MSYGFVCHGCDRRLETPYTTEGIDVTSEDGKRELAMIVARAEAWAGVHGWHCGHANGEGWYVCNACRATVFDPYPLGRREIRHIILRGDAAPIFHEVMDERMRQIEDGYGYEHDDEHGGGEITVAALAYLRANAIAGTSLPADKATCGWPWEAEGFKPGATRDNLMKAAALIFAEIGRIDRATAAAEVRVMEKMPAAIDAAMKEADL